MFALPTVRVVNPASPDEFMIINESDLTADHELWADAPAGSRIGKGPRGKWYVWFGRERAEGPFGTEAEAEAALSTRSGG